MTSVRPSSGGRTSPPQGLKCDECLYQAGDQSRVRAVTTKGLVIGM